MASGAFSADHVERRTSACRIALIGDAGVGKTALLRRFTGFSRFKRPGDVADDEGSSCCSSPSSPTVGVEFYVHDVVTDTNESVNVHLWDIAGDVGFRATSMNYVRNQEGILLCYDITRPETLERIAAMWKDDDFASRMGSVDKVLVGTKSDLADKRRVDETAARQFADAHGMSYVEVSSKNGKHVDQAYMKLVTAIIARRGKMWSVCDGLHRIGGVKLPPSSTVVRRRLHDHSSGSDDGTCICS